MWLRYVKISNLSPGLLDPSNCCLSTTVHWPPVWWPLRSAMVYLQGLSILGPIYSSNQLGNLKKDTRWFFLFKMNECLTLGVKNAFLHTLAPWGSPWKRNPWSNPLGQACILSLPLGDSQVVKALRNLAIETCGLVHSGIPYTCLTMESCWCAVSTIFPGNHIPMHTLEQH